MQQLEGARTDKHGGQTASAIGAMQRRISTQSHSTSAHTCSTVMQAQLLVAGSMLHMYTKGSSTYHQAM
jgi:hypothetical protein